MNKPNVLLICVEHWSGRRIGALGHPILTPTLNQLIGNGVAYTNAYATTPSCIPARREIMTGTFSPTHGDRVFNETLPMPALPTMAQTFRDSGYQAYAVGKLHVYPQRDRIGFDDAIIDEEGRHHLGLPKDDYEMSVSEHGYAGQEFGHGMGSNDYSARPWHLPEYLHHTNWTVREMSKVIVRRDTERPAFWYMSFSAPHPPLVPPADYLEMYQHLEIDEPFMGEWTQDEDNIPYALRQRRQGIGSYSDAEVQIARRALYAMSTHVDHQIRLIIGLLREEGLIDNTIIMFTADHGDMLGNHGQFEKDMFYEDSAKIPMILVPHTERNDIGHNKQDDRLAAHADIFPTLLDLCDIPSPSTVEGHSLVGETTRETLYGEHWENIHASRMIVEKQYKLIYYPIGNKSQLFDLQNDPDEMQNLAGDPAYSDVLTRLTNDLINKLYGTDLEWLDGNKLVGLKEDKDTPVEPLDRGLGGQRGLRFR